MKDNWIYIVLGIVVVVAIALIIGFGMMNNDLTDNTTGDLNNTNDVTNQNRVIDSNTNGTNNTNNSLTDNIDNKNMLDKTEFNNIKVEAEKLAMEIGNNVGNFTQDAIDAFNNARDELMTYDKEERQSQEEIDRRTKNLREAIDNLNSNKNAQNR